MSYDEVHRGWVLTVSREFPKGTCRWTFARHAFSTDISPKGHFPE